MEKATITVQSRYEIRSVPMHSPTTSPFYKASMAPKTPTAANPTTSIPRRDAPPVLDVTPLSVGVAGKEPEPEGTA